MGNESDRADCTSEASDKSERECEDKEKDASDLRPAFEAFLKAAIETPPPESEPPNSKE